jgi:hypothetical protein
MHMTELIEAARFVVDSEGQKKAVMLDYEHWQELLTLLEDLADLQEIDRIGISGEETIPWEQAKEELRAQGVDVGTAGGA